MKFLKGDFSETIRYVGLKFSEITEIVMLFKFQHLGFILLASSDNDEHMLMRQKM